MTAVARLLPWDSRRLLRFLTGLALIALAFTARMPASPEVAPVPPAAVVVSSAAAAPASVAQASVAQADEVELAPVSVPVFVMLAVGVVVALSGRFLSVRVGRAPPVG